jgi:hypothetical protein
MGAFRTVTALVRLVFIAVILFSIGFVVLRLHGVPRPLLDEMVRRINAAGIPVEVDELILTFGGWRADGVRYYGRNPDDLKPLFDIEHVFFDTRAAPWRNSASSWAVDVRAEGVRMSPSVEWGVDIPPDSQVRWIEKIDASLDFGKERIVLSDGAMKWLGSNFRVSGRILTSPQKRSRERTVVYTEPDSRSAVQETLFPVRLTQELFRRIENRLRMFSVPGGAAVDVDFTIDTGDYSASHVELAASAEEVSVAGMEFSAGDLSVVYSYPRIEVRRAAVFMGRRSLQLSAAYDIDSQIIQGEVFNSMTSNRLLLLLPDRINKALVKARVHIAELPRIDLSFGPARISEAMSTLAGSFFIRDLGYRDLVLETLSGDVRCNSNRIELQNLNGLLSGREHEASRTGSAMHGGAAEGVAFWDFGKKEFGIEAEGDIDPNLLVKALSPVPVANEIIERFDFYDQPPHIHIKLGSSVLDWSDFYLNLSAMAEDVAYNGVDCTSMNVTAAYRYKTLKLDPITITQGSRFFKGSATLKFSTSTAAFNAHSTMGVKELEEMIYPELGLFGEHLSTIGKTDIKAQGTLDWGAMRATDFSAKIWAEQLELPQLSVENFTADVVGKEQSVEVKNARFNIYGGTGSADFSILIDPTRNTLPYEMNAHISEVGFQNFVESFSHEADVSVTGVLDGWAYIKADFSTNFFAAATGTGTVSVVDGQLADLPLFRGFSRLMRMVVPGFSVFTISSLSGSFAIKEGVVYSEDTHFGGNLINASGRGKYSVAEGFDAYIQAEILKGSGLSRVVRVLTDPLMRFLEIKLEGDLINPSWRLQKLPTEIFNPFRRRKE